MNGVFRPCILAFNQSLEVFSRLQVPVVVARCAAAQGGGFRCGAHQICLRQAAQCGHHVPILLTGSSERI